MIIKSINNHTFCIEVHYAAQIYRIIPSLIPVKNSTGKRGRILIYIAENTLFSTK